MKEPTKEELEEFYTFYESIAGEYRMYSKVEYARLIWFRAKGYGKEEEPT